MSVLTTTHRSCSSLPRRRSSRRPRTRRSLRADPGRGTQGPRRRPGRADRQAARRRALDHRPGRRRRRAGAHRSPGGRQGTLPVILYMHGGGWVLGNAGTHDRLVRELAVGADAAVVFVEYDRSPEARYPVAIEQGYATAQWIVARGRGARARPERHRDRRRLGRRQHDRRAGADGEGARRRALRAPVDVLPGHRRRDGHRLLRAVRRGLLPHRRRRWRGSGTRTRPTSGARSRSPRHCAPPTSSSPACRRPS